MPTTTSEPGLSDVGFAEPGSVGTPECIIQYVTVDATLAGVSLDDILSIRQSCGWDKAVSTCEIELGSKPATGGYLDPVTVTVNGVLRFTGIMGFDWDATGYPQSVVLHAQDKLALVQKYRMEIGDLDPVDGQPGLWIGVLLGGPESGTLKQIVIAVLERCGLISGVDFDPANFADPPHVYGLIAPEEFTWRQDESGLEYLHRLFEATAGYRLFGSGDGQLYLAQIIGLPRVDAPDLTLIWGEDILDGARAKRSIDKTCNTVIVRGFDDGSGDGPLQVPAPDGLSVNAPNAIQPGPQMFPFTASSPLIEDEAFATELIDYWAQEVSRELWTATVPTWRDDVMGPAQTVLLDATDELLVGEKGWMLGSDLEVNQQNQLTQTLQLVGGGLPVDYDPLPI